jgi:hypothetical protein
MIKRKINLDDIRNVKLSISISKTEGKLLDNLSKNLKQSKTETLMKMLKENLIIK